MLKKNRGNELKLKNFRSKFEAEKVEIFTNFGNLAIRNQFLILDLKQSHKLKSLGFRVSLKFVYLTLW
jgi:hypothetical protein